MAPPPEFTQSPTKSFSIAVVGGGIAGLSLTLALLRHGVPTTLYESAPKLGEIGAGVSFGPNAVKAMKLISPHIYQGFENRATHNPRPEKHNSWFDFRYGEDCDGRRRVGELVATLECEGGQASVHRAHFLDEMVKLLPDGVAKFGKRAIDFEQLGDGGVLLKFQDGSTAQHDAVIGCDGIKSKMRVALLGEDNPASKATFSGKYAYRGLIPMEKAKALLGDELAQNSQMYLGRHGHILTFAIEKGQTMNVVAFASSDKWESKDWVVGMKKEDMYKDYSGWGESVKEILTMMEKPDVWALFDHPPADTYYKGRVALLGDAAHASTPHQGSGAAMAIEDAYLLGALLAEVDEAGDIEAAFKAYDATRRPRTQKLVTTSREAGRLWDLELEGDDPNAVGANLLKRLWWIWSHDPQAEFAEAKNLFQNR